MAGGTHLYIIGLVGRIYAQRGAIGLVGHIYTQREAIGLVGHIYTLEMCSVSTNGEQASPAIA